MLPYIQLEGENTMICKSCKLTMLSDSKYCPLCNIVVSDSNETDAGKSFVEKLQYPIYETKKKKPVTTTLTFISISVSLICVFINAFTLESQPLQWSLIVASTILCLYRSVFDWISSIKNSGSKIVSQFIWLAQLMIVIDIAIGYTGWSVSYVIPWFSIATTLAITIIALARKKDYTEYTGYLMASIAISVRLAFVAVLPITIVKWALLAALLYSLLTILGLYMFSKPQFKNELKKRFKR